ncbi:hypothetical protein VVD49_20310 [Uliginosibacterium sp. H3]|uniref:Lipoprotein n=1 Tax=Uliginosibacterium silvisoli TaxID=3114758 RepID=A0ABU6K8F7_9RHOO|nr:hypothetical protein [Uliginosibacterium sp. H3]
MFKACTSALVIVSLLSGCAALDSNGKLSTSLAKRGFDHPEYNGSFLPEGSFHLSPTYSITYADAMLIAGALVLVYFVVDPLSPSWEIKETRMPDNRVLYSMRMQYFHLGGDGEAYQVLERRATAYAQEQGVAKYEIRRFRESIDSRMIFPRRTAEAELVLIPPAPPEIKPVDMRPPLAALGVSLQPIR